MCSMNCWQACPTASIFLIKSIVLKLEIKYNGKANRGKLPTYKSLKDTISHAIKVSLLSFALAIYNHIISEVNFLYMNIILRLTGWFWLLHRYFLIRLIIVNFRDNALLLLICFCFSTKY